MSAIENSSLQLSQIIQGSPVPTFVIDEDHTLIYWNRACENLTGISANEILGTRKQWSAFYAEERPVLADLVVDDVPEEKIKEHYKGKYRESVIEGAYEAEDFFPDFGEKGKWLFFTAAPLKDAAGNIVGAIETLQDITERKRSEHELANLYATGQKLTSALELDDLLQGITERATKLTGADRALILLLDRETKEVTKVVSTGFASGQGQLDNFTYQEVEDGISGWVLRKGESTVSEDILTDPRNTGIALEAAKRESKTAGSIAVAPLSVQDKVIGTLTVINDAGRPVFNRDDLNLVSMFASQSAVAIENARLYDSLRKRTGELETLNRAVQAFSSTLDLDEVIVTVLKQVRNQLEVKATSIWLIAPPTKDLVCLASTGPYSEQVEGWRLALGKGLVGHVARDGESILVSDARKDERHFKDLEQLIGLEFRSILSVPLQTKNKVIGVVQALDTKVDGFSKTDKALLESLAASAAIAIENARLFDERDERADRLERLHNIVSFILTRSSDLDKVLYGIVKSISDIFQEASCGIRLYNSEKDEFTRLFASDALEEEVASYTPRPDGTSRYIIDVRKKPFYAQDASVTLPNDRPAIRAEIRERGVEAIAYLPLVVQQDVIGMLYVNWDAPRLFSDNDKKILQLFAHQAAIAIENARLFEELESRISDLSALSRISHGLSSTRFTAISDISRLFYEEARSRMDLENFYVASYDEARDLVKIEFCVEEGEEIEDDQFEPTVGKNRLTEYVIKTGETLYIPSNVGKWREEHKVYEGRPDDMRLAAESWLGVPIKMGDKVLGVIVAQNYDEENVYDAYNEGILSTIAAQIGLAMVSRNLAHQIDRLNILNEVVKQLTSNIQLDESQILEVIYKQASRVMDTDNMYIALYDEMTDTVSFDIMRVDGKHEYVEPRRAGKGRTEWIIQNREYILINTRSESERWYESANRQEYIGEPFASWLGVPIMTHEKVLGVIAVYHKTQEYLYDKNDLRTLFSLADQAAIAIENTRLFEQIQEQRETLVEGIQEISASITASLGRDKVLQGILDWTATLMGEASLCEIRLYEDNKNELVAHVSEGQEIDSSYRRLSVGEGITGWVAQQVLDAEHPEKVKAVYIPDVSIDERYKEFLGDTKCEIAVPMLSKDGILIGILNIEHPEEDAFDEHDRLLANAIANLAVAAIENARLFNDLKEGADRLVRLQEVSTAISAKTSDFEGILRLIAENLMEVFQGASCVIRLYDSKEDRFGDWVAAGVPEDEVGYSPRPDGTSRHIVKKKIPRYIEDTSVPPPDGYPAVSETIVRQGVRAAAHLPLLAEEDVIGVLYVNLAQPHRFSDNDKRILGLFADQAAIAIENAKLFEQLQKEVKRTKTLGLLGDTLATLEQEL